MCGGLMCGGLMCGGLMCCGLMCCGLMYGGLMCGGLMCGGSPGLASWPTLLEPPWPCWPCWLSPCLAITRQSMTLPLLPCLALALAPPSKRVLHSSAGPTRAGGQGPAQEHDEPPKQLCVVPHVMPQPAPRTVTTYPRAAHSAPANCSCSQDM
jgi:hypothetical protein